MRHFLSIDWDFITGDCTTDVPNCCGFCKLNQLEGPQRGGAKYLDPAWRDRLQATEKLRVAPGSPVVVAECHASILAALKQYTVEPVAILDLDHHCDREHVTDFSLVTGKKTRAFNLYELHCANWIWYAEQEGHTVRNTMEVKEVKRLTRCFQGVFLCLSSPWTPGLMDNHFFKLVSHFAKRSGIQPQFIGHKKNVLKKRYFRYLNSGKTSARILPKTKEPQSDSKIALGAIGGACTHRRLRGRTTGFSCERRSTRDARR